MRQSASVDLTDVIVSTARAVVEANRVLSEGTDTPMGITEFRIKYRLHASLSVRGPRLPAGSDSLAADRFQLVRPLRLVELTSLGLKERILTGYTGAGDLEISSVIQPLPKITQA
jgi:hypothetical protein